MKVRLSIDVNDLDRRAIAVHFHRTGKGTRRQVEIVATAAITARIEQLIDRYNHDPDVRRKAARKLNKLPPSMNMKPARPADANMLEEDFFETFPANAPVARKQG
jgi:hypothetical protein